MCPIISSKLENIRFLQNLNIDLKQIQFLLSHQFNMANAIMKFKQNFEENKILLTLNKLNNFNRYESDVFLIKGQPWVISMEKINENGIDSLDISFITHHKSESKNWAAFAECIVKLNAFKVNKEIYYKRATFIIFNGTTPCEFSPFIEWFKLMDSANSYVNNDTCIFEVSIKIRPIKDIAANDLLSFESIEKCCDSSSIAKYRFTVKNANDFFNSCSPVFIVSDLPWRIFFCRLTNGNWKIGENKFQIGLKSMWNGEASCDVTITWSLISFNLNIQPIKEQMMAKYEYDDFTFWDITTMTNLFNPIMKFIENDSFVIEVEIKIDNVIGSKVDAKNIKTNCKKLNCAICFGNLFDRSVSSLHCGHLFCTICITKALKQRNTCPLCNQEVVGGPPIRPIYITTNNWFVNFSKCFVY